MSDESKSPEFLRLQFEFSRAPKVSKVLSPKPVRFRSSRSPSTRDKKPLSSLSFRLLISLSFLRSVLWFSHDSFTPLTCQSSVEPRKTFELQRRSQSSSTSLSPSQHLTRPFIGLCGVFPSGTTAGIRKFQRSEIFVQGVNELYFNGFPRCYL